MINNRPITVAIILAGGSGSRMNSKITKQQMQICGKSVLHHTIAAFEAATSVDAITIVARADEIEFAKRESAGFGKVKCIVAGGKNRAESARLGFEASASGAQFILIHDGARCLITPGDIDAIASAAYAEGAATAARPVTDTVKRVDAEGMIYETLSREGLYAVQTPQAFSCELYARALAAKMDMNVQITDDNMLVENIGARIYPVITSSQNIKITTPDDLGVAEFLIMKRQKI